VRSLHLLLAWGDIVTQKTDSSFSTGIEYRVPSSGNLYISSFFERAVYSSPFYLSYNVIYLGLSDCDECNAVK